jgi:hypothetical protein
MTCLNCSYKGICKYVGKLDELNHAVEVTMRNKGIVDEEMFIGSVICKEYRTVRRDCKHD